MVAGAEALLLWLGPRADARRLRLFAVACCRRIGALLGCDERWPDCVEAAEAFADGSIGKEELWDRSETGRLKGYVEHGLAWQPEAGTAVQHAGTWSDAQGRPTGSFDTPVLFPTAQALRAAAGAAAALAYHQTDPEYSAVEMCYGGREPSPAYPAAVRDERRAQADLVRELFGNPFRAVACDPAWLSAGGAPALELAWSAYHERRFDLLPVLADALEDAGCIQEALLTHCRSGGAHVRGCWALDALLRAQSPARPEPGAIRQCPPQE